MLFFPPLLLHIVLGLFQVSVPKGWEVTRQWMVNALWRIGEDARRWGVMRADEQRQRRRWQHIQQQQQQMPSSRAAPQLLRSAVGHAVSACVRRQTGRRWKALAGFYDLRNSGGSERTDKAAVREMSVAGKLQPEVIERPASLPVPTSASKRLGFESVSDCRKAGLLRNLLKGYSAHPLT